MARPAHSDLLKRYSHKIRASKKWRDKEDLDQTWKRLINLYRGKHYQYLSEDDRLLVNIALSTVNVIAPSVAVNYPKITVNAVQPDDAARAIVVEGVINYWWRHYKVRPEFRRAIKDFLIVGHGWLKCGYKYVEKEEEVEDAGETEEVQSPSLDELMGDGPLEGAPVEHEPDPSEPTIIITEDRPFVERVSPLDVFVDPDATSMSDIAWIAQRVRRPLEDVKSDKRYSARVRNKTQADSWREEVDSERKMEDPEDGYVEVWEFYDLRKSTISVFTMDADGFLVAPRKMPYAFGHPFVMIRNYDIPDFFYPLGELEAIESLQYELNETRTQMMNHRKRFARKYLYRKDRFDSDGVAALKSDADNELVPVTKDSPLQDAIVPMPTVITPPEFYQQSQQIMADMETVSGVSEYMRGQMPDIRRTATEASMIADAASARAADKLATVELAISEVAVRLVMLAQQFMESEQVARVIGPDGVPVWFDFDADFISGDYDFEVEGGSTQPNNESFRRQSALQLMDAMAPLLQAGVVNPQAIAEHVLRYGFGIKNVEKFLVAPPPMGGSDPNAAPPEAAPSGGIPPVQGGIPPELMQILGAA